MKGPSLISSLAGIYFLIQVLNLNGWSQDKPAISRQPTLDEAKAEFKKADSALNRAYSDVKKALKEWKFELLAEEQRDWISYRDHRAEAAAVYDGSPEFEGREKESAQYWLMAAAVTDSRTEIVKAWTQNTVDGDYPWTGLWKDGNGGWMGIFADDTGKQMHFQIGVVRGPTYHMGDISGKAVINSRMAFFSDKGNSDKSDDEPETWLIFSKKYDSPRLEIEGVNTSYYHGMRAYFDGTYTRVGELSEKARKRILEGKSPFDDVDR